jgi:osmoprotectant transport system ATP-binding protein
MTVPKLLKWTAKQKEGIAESLLEKVELPHEYLDKRPANLSGGQQQRVGVIRALAADQSIILMDEPFGALDPITRSTLQDLIKKIHKEMQRTIIFVTHDMDEALKLANRIIVMDKGEIVQFDSPTNILSAPANDFVKTLLGPNKTNSLYRNSKKVKEIMKRDVKSICLNKSLIDAIKSMRDNRVNSLLVIDEHMTLKGYIDFTDIDANIMTATKVYEIMREDTSNVNENERLKDVVFPVLKRQFDYLPVVNDQHELTGIITKEVLVELLYNQMM